MMIDVVGKMRNFKYKESVLFILFNGLCALLAYSRGCLNEFGNIEFWVFIFGIVALIVATELNGNKRILMVAFMLMVIGNLIRSSLEVYLFHDEDYLQLRYQYPVVFAGMCIVIFLYPRIYKILSSRTAIAVMYGITVIVYVLTVAANKVENGALLRVFGVQVSEPMKFIFIFVLAGLLSKKYSMKNALLAVLYMAINAIGLFLMSEYGTLIIFTVVFLTFLFIFPNRLWLLGGVMMVGIVGLAGGYAIGQSLYNYTLKNCSSEVFASRFYDEIRTVELEKQESLSESEVIQKIIAGCLKNEDIQNNPEYRNTLQTESGKMAAGDMIDEKELAALCNIPVFREDFINTFCRSDFYGTSVKNIYDDEDFEIGLKSLNKNFLGLYVKAAERVILPFAPQLMGISPEEGELDQVNEAAYALSIGGMTGFGLHEFAYIPVMHEDMVFAALVSFFGFPIGCFIIMMYMIIFREGIRIQLHIENAPFHQGIALGISLILFVQALYIIGGNLGILPLTGVTLPFIAHGWTSLMVSAVFIAILFSISYLTMEEDDSFDHSRVLLFKYIRIGAGEGIKKAGGRIKVAGGYIKKAGDAIVEGIANSENLTDEDLENIEEDNDDAYGYRKKDESEKEKDYWEDESEEDAEDFDEDDDIEDSEDFDEDEDLEDSDAEDDIDMDDIEDVDEVESEEASDDTEDTVKRSNSIRNRDAKMRHGDTFYRRWGDDDDL